MKDEYKVLPSGRTPFNWNVWPEQRKKFDSICSLRGYKPQDQIDQMLRDWIAKEEAQLDKKDVAAIGSIIAREKHPGKFKNYIKRRANQ